MPEGDAPLVCYNSRILHGREVLSGCTVSIRSIQLLLLSYIFFPFNFLFRLPIYSPFGSESKTKKEINLEDDVLKRFNGRK
jgi:hypothetical protein